MLCIWDCVCRRCLFDAHCLPVSFTLLIWPKGDETTRARHSLEIHFFHYRCYLSCSISAMNYEYNCCARALARVRRSNTHFHCMQFISFFQALIDKIVKHIVFGASVCVWQSSPVTSDQSDNEKKCGFFFQFSFFFVCHACERHNEETLV